MRGVWKYLQRGVIMGRRTLAIGRLLSDTHRCALQSFYYVQCIAYLTNLKYYLITVSMGKNLTHKILKTHIVAGQLTPGSEIAIKIDHTLLQDATATVVMLEFEALGLGCVKAELAAQYVDHNLLQTDTKNA